MTNRVVITGMGTVSPIGTGWDEVEERLRTGDTGIAEKKEWREYDGLEGRLAGTVDLDREDLEEGIHPRHLRSMGRVALLAVRATRLALEDAELMDHPSLHEDRTGISYGSTEGSQSASQKFTEQIIRKKTLDNVRLSDYLQSMTHTCPANLAQHFEIPGRLMSTSTACTSGSQGIGFGYEAVKHGKQDVMVTGGAEELVISAAAVFNIMFGASTRYEQPIATPRPFDRDRDGLVVSEGAGTMILESRDHALDRGADIYGEIVGYATTCLAEHITIPSGEAMIPVLKKALADADLAPEEVDYINAHATATEKGDRAESQAMEAVFGRDVPVSSLKGHLGHTLGACGAIESNLSVRMARDGWLAHNLHLDEPGEECADLQYVRDEPAPANPEYIMCNNFAFGGVNTSIIIRVGEE